MALRNVDTMAPDSNRARPRASWVGICPKGCSDGNGRHGRFMADLLLKELKGRSLYGVKVRSAAVGRRTRLTSRR